jgi:hypothetical protein
METELDRSVSVDAGNREKRHPDWDTAWTNAANAPSIQLASGNADHGSKQPSNGQLDWQK